MSIVARYASRLRWFLRFQGCAFRALFRRRRKLIATLEEQAGPPHPSHLCRCHDGRPALGIHDSHRDDCAWLAAMCRECRGTGWCQACGGDGTDARSTVAIGEPAKLRLL